jgi:hypothetical protein
MPRLASAFIPPLALASLGCSFVRCYGGIGMLLEPLSKLWRHAPADATALKSFALTLAPEVTQRAALSHCRRATARERFRE